LLHKGIANEVIVDVILLLKGCPIEMENTVKVLCKASAPDLK
jgi:hypothetical protein